MLGNVHDAEDAAQDVMCKFVANRERVENPWAWLPEVARNTARDWVRRRAKARRGTRCPRRQFYEAAVDEAIFNEELKIVKMEMDSLPGHFANALFDERKNK